MRLVFFTVTEADIAAGVPRNATECPLVRALRRAVPPPPRPLFFLTSRLPRRIRAAVESVDAGESLSPQTFILDLDCAVLDPLAALPRDG